MERGGKWSKFTYTTQNNESISVSIFETYLKEHYKGKLGGSTYNLFYLILN